MRPNKVEQTIVIKENRKKVDEFKNKPTYNIVETGENAFLHIDIDDIIREEEDIFEENDDNTLESDENDSSFEEDYDSDASDFEEAIYTE